MPKRSRLCACPPAAATSEPTRQGFHWAVSRALVTTLLQHEVCVCVARFDRGPRALPTCRRFETQGQPMQARILVGVPAYNGARHIAETLQCISEQDFAAFQV